MRKDSAMRYEDRMDDLVGRFMLFAAGFAAAILLLDWLK
jgi:hypothetical protein